MRAPNPLLQSRRKSGPMRFLFSLLWVPTFVGIVLIGYCAPAFAADEEKPAEKTEDAKPEEKKNEAPAKEETPTEKGFPYSPDYCEFKTSFPEEPYTLKQCEGGDQTKCFEQLSYTQVFELSATVTFRVVCNPSKPELFKEYSPAVMEAALKGMTREHYVKEIDSNFREGNGYKQAGLVAQGTSGRSDKIYIAQLWIGQQSVMSVEAEMIGEPNDAADALFSTLLEGVQYSGIKPPPEK